MTKRFLHQLVKESFKGRELDSEKIEKIAKLLKRKELKAYTRALKLELNKNTVTVVTSTKVDSSMQKQFEESFANKRLDFVIDPDILLGVKITDNDMVYDSTLKGSFNRIRQYIKE